MSEFWQAALGLFAAVAPLGGLQAFSALSAESGQQQRARLALAVNLLAFGLIATAAAIGDAFLEWLDVSPENFQIAAGLVMMPLAARLLWQGRTMAATSNEAGSALWMTWLAPLTVSLVAGPASLTAAISYGTRFGVGTTVGSAALVLALATLAFAASPRLLQAVGDIGAATLGRLTGALLIIVAVELMVDGVQSV